MTAAARITPAPIRKSITVDAPVDRAFEVFTKGFGTWWPATHSIGRTALRNAVIEPKAGGRWYEIGEDGSECDWGEVLAWDRPTRLVLAWRIGFDWRYDPNLLTEVEVRFTPVGDGATRVDFEHRLLENMGANAAAARETYDSPGGWAGLLTAYGSKVKAG
jgi:uncharacterized protein YndB with AHSA1/START domain